MGAEVHPIMTTRKYLKTPTPITFTEPLDVSQDITDKVNAGARLTYAMFLHPDAAALFASPFMTPALRAAYLSAARAWGL